MKKLVWIAAGLVVGAGLYVWLTSDIDRDLWDDVHEPPL